MLRQLILILLLGMANTSWASTYQSFWGLNFGNPAELTDAVKKNMQVIFGGGLLMPIRTFAGKVIAPSPQATQVLTVGTATSTGNTLIIPYGRFAKRLSDQVVIGVDITEPFVLLVAWPTNSVVRYASTELKTNSADIQPNIAYQFSGSWSKLSVGIGVDILYLSLIMDKMHPSAVTDLFSSIDVSGWATGWHAGIYYHLFEPTFVGISYFFSFNSSYERKKYLCKLCPNQ